ncbi:caspase-1 isoform X1 [Amyelois transitella]|uniref:caspase-1 isoform X1 n=1 Tax=Amyelois transitella TaxID=680683 RepID=UPI00298F7334|nr:caspase-1 isoform X1 [Amyelois transitella]
MDHADVAVPFNSNKANTSRADTNSVQEENVIYENRPSPNDEDYYDMSKKKYLHIFNHYVYKQTREFGNKKPKDRVGTHHDVKILETTFKNLGFEVKSHQDLPHSKIIKAVEKLINQDHSSTSCVALAILTHGSNDGYLYAEDEPYELKEITRLLENQRLVLIPKLLFLQISQMMDSLPRQPKMFRRMSSLRASFKRFNRSISTRTSKFWVSIRSSASITTSDAAPITNGACRGHTLDKGHEVEVDGIIRNLVRVPSHIDFLILHSSADGHASFRCHKEGSWMIQSLCEVIKKYHTTHDILQIITLVNKRVAYDFTAYNTNYPSYNNKKQTLEARYTLTKFLKL